MRFNLIKCIFLILIISGCASLPVKEKNEIKSKSGWMKLYRYPYEDVFNVTLAVLKNRGDRMIIKYDKDNHYILTGYGPIMLSYVWYEVYHFEEISPRDTFLKLGYVISGPLFKTIHIKDEKLIKETIFAQIEVYLIVQEVMRRKYKDFSILEVNFPTNVFY